MELKIERYKKNVKSFIVLGSELLEKSKELSVSFAGDVQVANALLKDCQKTEKDLEEKRIEIVKPVNDFVKEVNVLIKETMTPILEAKAITKSKILAYSEEQDRIRRAEEEKRLTEERERLRKLEDERLERERIEREKRQAEEKILADKRKRLSEEQAAVEKERLEIERQKREVEEEKKRIEEERSLEIDRKQKEAAAKMAEKDNPFKGIRKVTKFEIVNDVLVPREYCSPDNTKINAAIKKGVLEIPGLRIFTDTRVQ